jgi:putative SOS response-associated peptidase YedK
MCYSAVSIARQLVKYAKHRSDDPELIENLQQELDQKVKSEYIHYFADAYTHPRLLCFTMDSPFQPKFLYWGLIPPWVKNEEDAYKMSNQTLNARGETIFEKLSFKNSAKKKRCIIYLDAFFEYFHFKGKTYPYHISLRNGDPLIVAGLYNNWVNVETGEIIETVSIITTKANEFMKKIHNNPKAKEARMPAILDKNKQDIWLGNLDEASVKMLIRPLPENVLTAHTVKKLKGKDGVGNKPEAEKYFEYVELK